MEATAPVAPEVIAERKARRLLRITAIAGAILVVIGMVAAVLRLRAEAFDKADWDRGRGILTKDNPRLRMQRDVTFKFNRGLERKRVLDLFGPPDPYFAVKSPHGTTQPYQPANSLVYMLGVERGGLASPPVLRCLIVEFDPGGMGHGYVDGVPYKPGDKIIPAKPMSTPRWSPYSTVTLKKTKPKAKSKSPSKTKPAGP